MDKQSQACAETATCTAASTADGQGVSRRTFLSSVAAAGAVGALGSQIAVAAEDEAEQQEAEGAATEPFAVPDEFTAFDCDVLVIGAGAAGTEAAIAARNAGASVIIVDKRQLAKCGNSGLHSSGRMTSSEFGIDGDDPQVQLEDAVEMGYYIVDQEYGKAVLEGYANEKVLMASENYGNIHWRDVETGDPLIEPCYNRNRLWTGYKLFNHAYEALRVGVKVYDYCTVTGLLTNAAGSVVGATGIDFKTGEFYVFRAKSVVLATGGENQLFGAGSVVAKYSGGAYGLTGDGCAMAAELGVEFKDLEFKSTELGSPLEPNPICNATVVGPWGPTPEAPWLDRNGDDVFADVPEEERAYYRGQFYAIQKMVEEGRAGDNDGYFAPVTWMPFRDWGGTIGAGLETFGFFADDWDAIPCQWEHRGMDMSSVEQQFNFVYMYGGAVTSVKQESNIDGLYICGEMNMCTGAGYTVFRVFSNCLVTGRWAGANAAERALGMETCEVDWNQVADEYRRVFGILYAEPENPERVSVVRHKVQDAAYLGAGMWRSDKKCTAALAALDEIEANDVPNMYVADKSKICNIDWMEALETLCMITWARMDIVAARTRTESRGGHCRNEYPDMDNDNWLKNVYMRLEDGKPVAETRDVVVTTVPLPSGKIPQGGGILPE